MTTSLIGKKVKVAGNTVHLNGQANMQYSLPGDAAKVTVSVYDATGALVRQQDIMARAPENTALSGTARTRTARCSLPVSTRFSIDAVDGTGQALTAVPLAYGTVTSVGFENNITYLSIDGTKRVQLGDILEIGGV